MGTTRRRSSIDYDALEECRTLGDAIHEPEIFLDKELSAEFICVICQCICSTPMDIGCKNGHIYCKECLNVFFEATKNGNAQCPQCQDNVTRFGASINRFALRLLLKQRILCPFSIQNCDDEKEADLYDCEWIGFYSDIMEHLTNHCKYG